MKFNYIKRVRKDIFVKKAIPNERIRRGKEIA